MTATKFIVSATAALTILNTASATTTFPSSTNGFFGLASTTATSANIMRQQPGWMVGTTLRGGSMGK